MAATALRLSSEEFLAWEAEQPVKHEYHYGEVFAMAGGSPEHARIGANVAFSLERQIRGGPCKVFSSDLAVELDEAGHFAYPDVTVVCGDVRVRPDSHVVQNPTLVAEVLSPSTAAWDRTGKLRKYLAMPSVQEVLLVETAWQAAEVYRRDAEGWRFLYPDPEGVIALPSVGATLALGDLYDGADVPSEMPSPPAEARERPG